MLFDASFSLFFIVFFSTFAKVCLSLLDRFCFFAMEKGRVTPHERGGAYNHVKFTAFGRCSIEKRQFPPLQSFCFLFPFSGVCFLAAFFSLNFTDFLLFLSFFLSLSLSLSLSYSTSVFLAISLYQHLSSSFSHFFFLIFLRE